MRNFALAAFGAVFAVALLVLGIAAGNDKGGVAFTNASAPVGEVVSLGPGGTSCERVDAPAGFDAVRLITIAKTNGQQLRAVVREPASGAVIGRGHGLLPAGNGQVGVYVGRVRGGRTIDLCLQNASARRIGLYGAPGRARARRNGVNRAGDPTLVFETEPRSLLHRIPDAFQRAALFKPGFLGAWSFWLLAALVLLAVPALTALALSRATGGGAPPAPAKRWRRFQSEVEPRLVAAPRVHRFARPPVLGDPGAAAAPVALCIEPVAGGDSARTRASIERGTQAPALVVEGTAAEALAATTARHVAVVRAGDELAPVAVERLGQAAALAPDAAFITCDEDELNGSGRREDPHLRPGPSPDLLLAKDLTGSLVLIDRERAGDLDLAAPRWRYRAALRLGGPGGEGMAHVPAILCHRAGVPSEERNGVVEEALRSWGQAGASVEHGPEGRRVRRPLAGEPSVEAIVLFRDRPELLRRCATSVLGGTGYENFRLRLVDNGSEEPEMAELLGSLDKDARVTIARDERPFNFAALNNAAAGASDSDFVLFVNNDTELISTTWIEDMLEEAARPEVGAVAPLLLFPGGSVQHAGAALGMHGYAGHPFAGLEPAQRTAFGAATDGTRNWLAVTAACMMVERYKLRQVGGFDESFVVAGNDVDLCLRLTRAGYRSLCVPHVRLVHDEGGSRGLHIDPEDFGSSDRSYGEFRTIGDPFYNPNLTLQRTDCGPRLPEEL
jgi:GT2 family glycosyltransferase